jgi:hypothetical protein
LPAGSIRALVALTVVGVFVAQTLKGQSVGLLLSEALLIILAHYFASRRLLSIPRDLKSQLEAKGLLGEEPRPLWLPRHSVRILIAGAFLFTALVLLLRGELFQEGVFDNLFLVFSYLIGVLALNLRERVAAKPPGRWGRGWLHIKALLVLLACVLIVFFAWSDALDTLPSLLEKILLGWILFYFGSR